jgi:hypothetical protein
VRPEGLGKMKKLIHLIGSRTRDLKSASVFLSFQQVMHRDRKWSDFPLNSNGLTEKREEGENK